MEKEITIRVKSPVDCTEDEFREWVEFSLHYNGGISLQNPLSDYDLEVTDIDFN